MIAAVGAYRHFTLGESHDLSLRPAPSMGFEELGDGEEG